MDAPLAVVSDTLAAHFVICLRTDFSQGDAKHITHTEKHTKTGPVVNKQCDAHFSLSVDKGSCCIEAITSGAFQGAILLDYLAAAVMRRYKFLWSVLSNATCSRGKQTPENVVCDQKRMDDSFLLPDFGSLDFFLCETKPKPNAPQTHQLIRTRANKL